MTATFDLPALRTQQTPAPLATGLGLVAQVVPTWEETVLKALSSVAGEVVVVIGHSNTIPKIIHPLGDLMPAMTVLQGHEDLFIATVLRPNSVRVVHLKYGN